MVLFEDGPFRLLLEECDVRVQVLRLEKVKGIRRESGLGVLLSKVPALLALRSRLAHVAAGFDVLYANSQKAFLLAALSKHKRQKLVWHLRDILTAEHFSPILRRIAVFAGNHFATLVVANSQATGKAFLDAGGRPEKLRVVHDGVSPEPFDLVTQSTVDALRKKLGATTGPLIGVFGRLSPWKGQHVFLEALSGLPDAQGVLVGDALFGEDEYAASLHVRAAKPDLAGRVQFLGFRRDIPALMRAMDLIVHSSVAAEPFGLVIVEGMLAARPVIATRAGGALEIITDDAVGLLVSPGSSDELRKACRQMLNQPERAERVARAGRARAEQDFSVERLRQKLTAILVELE